MSERPPGDLQTGQFTPKFRLEYERERRRRKSNEIARQIKPEIKGPNPDLCARLAPAMHDKIYSFASYLFQGFSALAVLHCNISVRREPQ